MWALLQQERPEDVVLGTGEAHSVKEFLEEAFGYANLDWRQHVEVDPRYYRPTEVDFLQADSAKAHRLLGWSPRVTFRELVRIMVDADMEAVGVKPRGEGLQILKGKFGDWHRWETGVTAVLKGSGAGVD
jgi:GDPmannose 4,6-dehydratase